MFQGHSTDRHDLQENAPSAMYMATFVHGMVPLGSRVADVTLKSWRSSSALSDQSFDFGILFAVTNRRICKEWDQGSRDLKVLTERLLAIGELKMKDAQHGNWERAYLSSWDACVVHHDQNARRDCN